MISRSKAASPHAADDPDPGLPGFQRQITAFWNTVAPNYETTDNVAPVGTADYANWVADLVTR